MKVPVLKYMGKLKTVQTMEWIRAHKNEKLDLPCFSCVLCTVQIEKLMQASACNTDTTPIQPHRNSNTHRNKNNTNNMVIQQKSRIVLGVVGLEWYACCRLKHNKLCFSLQHGYHSNPTTPKLQHTSKQEQYEQCGNSIEESHRSWCGWVGVVSVWQAKAQQVVL